MVTIYYEFDGKLFTEVSEFYIHLKKTLPKQEYLYGKVIEGLDTMLYKDALDLKIELSTKLVTRILNTPLGFRDNARLSATLASQKHNHMLLDELKGK